MTRTSTRSSEIELLTSATVTAIDPGRVDGVTSRTAASWPSTGCC